MDLPEITAPVDLCLPSGVLNPQAVGWTRRPLHRANLRTGSTLGRASTWSRTKCSEQWCLITPTHVVTLTASALNYAGVHQVWVLVRGTGEEIDASTATPMARGTRMPSTCGTGPVRARGGDLAIAVDPVEDGTRVRAVAPRVRLDATVTREPGHEALGVVMPWSERLFQYTVKDVGLAARGRLWLDEHEHVIGGDSPAWAVQDFGRGRWPYAVSWNRAAGVGLVRDRVIGLHLGGSRATGTGVTENALVVDGRVHYIDEELSWTYDSTSPAATWVVTGARAELRLEPFHHQVSTVDLRILSSRTVRHFGTWYGWLTDADGTRHPVDGLEGWAEEVTNRW